MILQHMNVLLCHWIQNYDEYLNIIYRNQEMQLSSIHQIIFNSKFYKNQMRNTYISNCVKNGELKNVKKPPYQKNTTQNIIYLKQPINAKILNQLLFINLYISKHNTKQANIIMKKSDRFITPKFHTKFSDSDSYSHPLTENNINIDDETKVTKLYRKLVMNQHTKENKQNNESYHSMKLIDDEDIDQNSYQYLSKLGIDISKIQLGPTIINKPDRILEALSLSDNFYLNLLDCSGSKSSDEYVLAVGLSRGIYLWSSKGSISRIREKSDIASLQWSPLRPHLIGCGTKAGHAQVWDAQQNFCIAEYLEHQGRVGCISWLQDRNCFMSGGKDSQIITYDIRTNRRTGKYKFHSQQICSLKVQNSHHVFSDTFASGSNDKNLAIWNTRMRNNPIHIYEHSAAVKGVAWHPLKNGILASGGGTEDRNIRIWNTSSNQMVKSIDTGSQVCNLMYIKDGQNLVSSHGFHKYQTNIWDASTLVKQQSLIGHTKRVLYLTAQPQGDTIVTGAGDQTIRFWKLKENKKKEKEVQQSGKLTATIR